MRKSLLFSPAMTAQEWKGQSGIWHITKLDIIDIKDREGKERENYLIGEMQALYIPSKRKGGLYLIYLE